MKKLFILLPVFISCCMCKTPDYDRRLQFVNNSDKCIDIGTSDVNDNYRDTSFLWINYSPAGHKEQYKIPPNSSITYLVYIPWNKIYSLRDTVAFYVFDADLLETTSWDIVRENYLVLQRYDLGLQDLQDLNWTLYYPPNATMKHMKMYPPYKEGE